MRLTAPQMALMSRLLDEALPLDQAGRRRWLETLALLLVAPPPPPPPPPVPPPTPTVLEQPVQPVSENKTPDCVLRPPAIATMETSPAPNPLGTFTLI